MNDYQNIINQSRFQFIALMGGNMAKKEDHFPRWKQIRNWMISKILFRSAYQVAPGLWKSRGFFTMAPEIYDYEEERDWE